MSRPLSRQPMRSAQVMLDGAQRAPHGPIDLRDLNVDFYAFSGHKAFGRLELGCLWGAATYSTHWRHS